uniref:endonuclease/exonuclease/phosphatase family protein n=1 Tax=Amycolatopsis sp. CA-293810 TaxID=3239926 RepID=UPI003F49398A
MITLLSVNTWNLYGSDGAEDQQRFRAMEELIRSRDADIIAVQEIISTGEAAAAAAGRRTPTTQDKTPGAIAGLRRLAEATGRRCEVAGDPAVAVGGNIHHTGLLWRDGIDPVPGTMQLLQRDGAGMWHCATACVFDVGGPTLRAGSTQLSPFDQAWAAMDANQLMRVFNRDDIPGFLGGDFNGIGAQKLISAGSEVWYDQDPYAPGDARDESGTPWHPDHAYQLDGSGQLDRQAAIRLEHPRLGGLRDCALLTGTPWAPTTGFHSQDNHPRRRVDRWYATRTVPDAAVTGFRVVPVDEHRVLINGRQVELTDHTLIEIDVDEHALVKDGRA